VQQKKTILSSNYLTVITKIESVVGVGKKNSANNINWMLMRTDKDIDCIQLTVLSF